MLEGVPNFAFAIGYTNASWTLKADLTGDIRAGCCATWTRTAASNACRVTTTRRSPTGRCSTWRRSTCSGPRTACRRHPRALAGPPELPPRLPVAEAQRHRRWHAGDQRSHERDTVSPCGRRTEPGEGTHHAGRQGQGRRHHRRRARASAASWRIELARGAVPPRDLRRQLEEGLAETVALAQARGVSVTAQKLDVADRAAVSRLGRPGRRRPRPGQPDLQQRRRRAGQPPSKAHLRGLRVDHGHQLLGRGARHQGVPAAPARLAATATSSTSRACSA